MKITQCVFWVEGVILICLFTWITAPFAGRSFCMEGGNFMETRIALLAIIVEDPDSVEQLNALLHDYSAYIIGRMGIPYREKGVHIISIAIDAPQDMIASLSGKIGNLEGISIKTAYSNIITKKDA